MKNILFLISFVLTVDVSLGQIEPGEYEIAFLDGYEMFLTIDSLGEDGNSKFFSYSTDKKCILLCVISCWEYKDSVLSYYYQVEKQRSSCEDEFLPEDEIEAYSYRITKIGKNYFVGRSIEYPETLIKWARKE